MKNPDARDCKLGSRAPLPPKKEAVRAQYGEEAELYARVRAETAGAAGRAEAAEEWQDVENDIAQEEAGNTQRREGSTK